MFPGYLKMLTTFALKDIGVQPRTVPTIESAKYSKEDPDKAIKVGSTRGENVPTRKMLSSVPEEIWRSRQNPDG